MRLISQMPRIAELTWLPKRKDRAAVHRRRRLERGFRPHPGTSALLVASNRPAT